MNSIKTLFIGTSEFAVPILKKLSELDFVELGGIVSQPDRAVGRHHSELQPSAVGELAGELVNSTMDLKVYKPESLKAETAEILETVQPDLIIVASYGQMIPNQMLEFPKYGCINVHASLLPKLRGAVPIPRAILDGMEKTGVSFQKMVEKLDAGDVIASYEMELSDDETAETLMQKLSDLAAEKLGEVIGRWVSGGLKAIPQSETEATYCSQADIAKENAQIRPSTEVVQAERMIRAFYPWPVAWGFVKLNGTTKRLKIYRAKLSDIELNDMNIKGDDINAELNDILMLKRIGNQLFLSLKNGILELLELQLEGKERKPASEYLFIA